MSGPKDFNIIYAAIRAWQIQQRMKREAEVRAAALAREMELNRQRAAEIVERGREARQQKTQEELAEMRQRNQRILDDSRQSSQPAPPLANPADEKRLGEAITSIVGWQSALGADQSTKTFRAAAATEWQQRARQLLDDQSHGLALEAALPRAAELLAQAQTLHNEAGELKAKFDTRNELLKDIIDSMKEIGFFVHDPHYENPADPTGPVIIKAVRGDEEVTTSVDLSETIKSVWNGLADERCKDSFFDYVDQLKAKGVEVEAHRDDLRDRPILKQKGANELPHSATKERGS